ncbi:rhomboid family intramembrane serine protease [Botrimarina hoheduenensis]|uniref:Rhomboid family protein n=1 Tax=Botrimarina hoheduenensis TaxID=2528000 RepID=A0A5C5W9L3_9BACT|nr:rhomboid family intramembrane serine protease [Botrimarina hoheduenensis]TWT46701.1 Rhomboid family protein [Botrimarina hoheduenensis]
MGIYDRDYERSYDTGSGWRDGGGRGGGSGFANWSANAKLLAVLGVVYLLQLFTLSRGAGMAAPESLVTNLLELPADWYQRPWRIYTLVTYALAHDTRGIQHLFFNGLALFFFGRAVEPRLGGREYLAFFFASAAFAGLVWSVAEQFDNGPQGMLVGADGVVASVAPGLVGASGGISAILILFALWYPHVKVLLFGVVPMPAWLLAVVFLGQDMFGAVTRSGNIAYTAHLGGALFGFLYFRYGLRLSDWFEAAEGGLKLPSLKRRPKLRVHREAETEADPDEEQLDAVLRKIQATGQDSLTAAERRILARASRRFKERRE